MCAAWPHGRHVRQSHKPSCSAPIIPDKGVRVTEEDGKLVIEAALRVTYGLNIAAIVRSITIK